MARKIYDTRTIFTHAAGILGGFLWLKIYCSQEKRLSLLLKKRIRKMKSMHYMTVESRYYTSL